MTKTEIKLEKEAGDGPFFKKSFAVALLIGTRWFLCTFTLAISMTRFGEISPIWYDFKSLGHLFGGLFSFWQNVDPTEAKMFCHWASIHCCRRPNTLNKFCHLVTLLAIDTVQIQFGACQKWKS